MVKAVPDPTPAKDSSPTKSNSNSTLSQDVTRYKVVDVTPSWKSVAFCCRRCCTFFTLPWGWAKGKRWRAASSRLRTLESVGDKRRKEGGDTPSRSPNDINNEGNPNRRASSLMNRFSQFFGGTFGTGV